MHHDPILGQDALDAARPLETNDQSVFAGSPIPLGTPPLYDFPTFPFLSLRGRKRRKCRKALERNWYKGLRRIPVFTWVLRTGPFRTQNPPSARACGFESRLRHHVSPLESERYAVGPRLCRVAKSANGTLLAQLYGRSDGLRVGSRVARTAQGRAPRPLLIKLPRLKLPNTCERYSLTLGVRYHRSWRLPPGFRTGGHRHANVEVG